MQKPTQVVGQRVAATIIDGIIGLAVTAIAFFALSTQVPGKCPSSGGGYTIGDNCRGFLVGQSGKQAAFYVIVFAFAIVQYWILPGIKGWSFGKLAAGIRLVNAEGRPPGILRAILRWILWIVDDFPYIIPYLTGFIVALTSANNQRVGDMAANTYVVRKDAVGAPVLSQGQYGSPQPAFAGAGPSAAAGYGPPPQPQQQPQPAAAASQAADWYPDPQRQARLRYWDGQRWTEHTSA
jgi:uncharacterized RDD family membrane protein YckC